MYLHVQEKVKLARRTLYALMGAGLHGLNGLHPLVSVHLYKTYVIPRFLTGLECVILNRKEIDLLESFHRKVLKSIQHLPDRCASAAVYFLLGEPPIEAILHVRSLTLLGSILRQPDTVLNTLALSRIHHYPAPAGSWFEYVDTLLQKYRLRSLQELVRTLPSKSAWKTEVKTAIVGYWEMQLRADAELKSSLVYMDIEHCHLKSAHQLWTSTYSSPHDIRRAMVKAKVLTGTYTLQVNKAKFNQHEVDNMCRLCSSNPEDRTHFLIICPALETIRRPYIQNLSVLIPIDQMSLESIVRVVLDSSSVIVFKGGERDIGINKSSIESISRCLIFALHCERARKLQYRP
jgi:hypothetical protein